MTKQFPGIPLQRGVVTAFLLTLIVAVSSQSQACDAASLVSYQVEDGVDPLHAEYIKQGIALADDYFKEKLGRTVCVRVTVRMFAGSTHPSGEGRTFGVTSDRQAAVIEITPAASGAKPRHERM